MTTTAGNDDDQRTWTALGVRMGFTSERAQRAEVLDAVQRMTWSETPGIPPHVEGPAVRAIVNAVHCGNHLRRVGVVQIDADRQLVGLEDILGTRHFVLGLDAEAICVLTELDRDRHRTGSENRESGMLTVHAAPPPVSAVTTKLADISDEIRAAALDLRERRTQELIAEGSSDEEALHFASEEALQYARCLIHDAKRHAAIRQLVGAYDGNTYRLLRDVADHLGASLAYVDRATVEAHLERTLSDAEWIATNDQFSAMDFDEHIGDQKTFRTDWIETVLERAGVPGFGHTTDGQPVDRLSEQSDGRAAGMSRHFAGVRGCTDRLAGWSQLHRKSNSISTT